MKDIAQTIVFGGIAVVLFIPLIVSDSMFFPYITGKNFWFRIIVEIVFAAWVILALYDEKYRPRFSWFLPSIGALLAVMFVANLQGAHQQLSFWSNFERMDGYVTLVHFAMYFLVVGSVLSHRPIDFLGIKTTSWQVFFVTGLVAALLVAFTAFQQLSGQVATTMGWRINGTLGNASYMAIYMLFNAFLALWVAAHTKQRWLQVIAFALSALFVFLVIQTATRGTIIGLAAGSLLGALFVAIAHKQYPSVRKWSLGVVVAIVMLVGLLAVYKDSSFVQNNLILQRSTAINSTELSLRMDIWNIALEGAQERPVLGWGQSNFNYVFNQYYQPDFSWRAEQWYDRAHNVFMDWLVTGGIFGLIAYLSIFIAGAYYLLWMPFRSQTPPFTVIEYGLLLGISSAYFVHNLVVFDNIVSYIFFAILLALVHSRVSTPIASIEKKKVDTTIVTQIAAPVLVVATIVIVYMVNVPGMQAAADIIDAFRATTVAGKQEAFDAAYARGSFAQQEITEQMAQQALSMIGNTSLNQNEVATFVAASEQRLLELANDKPGDARVHVFLTSFYRGIGEIEKAREQGKIARELSPEKPHIILDQGMVEYQAGDIQLMNEYMKEAYELAPKNKDAQTYYAISQLLAGKDEEEAASVVMEDNWEQFALNNLAIQAADQAGANNLMKRMLETRIAAASTTPQNYFSLSFVYYRVGEIDQAVATLERAIKAVPSVSATAGCYINNLKNGVEPNTGC